MSLILCENLVNHGVGSFKNWSVSRLLTDQDADAFNIIQPTLIEQLKKILDEYPDDGQILKVTTYDL